MNEYLDSTGADEGLSQSHFNRMLALGCFDILITLPIVIILLVIDILDGGNFEFYQGWTYIHTQWGAAPVPKSEWSATIWNRFLLRWDEWINPFYALVFFVLFGLTSEARNGYRRFFRFLGTPFRVERADSTAEDVLPDAIFKSGKDLNESYSSNTSSEYVVVFFSPVRFYSQLMNAGTVLDQKLLYEAQPTFFLGMQTVKM